MRAFHARAIAVAAGLIAAVSVAQLLAAAPKAPALAQGALVRIAGLGAGVMDLAVSPDGRTIASAGTDGTIRLWAASDGSVLAVLAGDGGPVLDLEFSPDGTRLAGAYADGAVRVWDPASATGPHHQFRAHRREARALAYSPDGKTLATGGPEGVVCLWDAETSALVRRLVPGTQDLPLRAAPATIRGLAYSPDGGLLASAHGRFDPFVHVWEPQSGREIKRLNTDGEAVQALVFSEDGATLATASDAGQEMTLWETASWGVRRRINCGGGAPEFPFAFSADGRWLWSVTGDELWRWDLALGRRVHKLAGEHRARITALAFAPRDARIVSSDEDGVAVVWDGMSPRRDEPLRAADDVQLEGLWAALADEDAAAAYDASWTLTAAGEQAVSYLRNRLPRQPKADADTVRRLMDQLDDERFTVRERAMRDLAQLGDGAEPLLRERRAKTASPEVAQRIEVMLDAFQQSAVDSESLRGVRSIEVLERIGTEPARAALREVAEGSSAYLKSHALAALRRLDLRKAAPSTPTRQ